MERLIENWESFISSKFGIILGIFFLMLVVFNIFLYNKRDVFGAFFLRLVDRNDTLSMTNFQLLFTVLISNFCFWPTWLVMCIMDNIDNTPDMSFTMIDPPAGLLTAYLAAQGLSLLGKYGQQSVQAKNGNPDNPAK